MQLDFNKVHKNYLTVTLVNGKSYMVTTPKKRLFNKILELEPLINKENEKFSPQDVDDLYATCAEIISTNKTNTKITDEELGEILDLDDVILLLKTYEKYLESITNLKN